MKSFDMGLDVQASSGQSARLQIFRRYRMRILRLTTAALMALLAQPTWSASMTITVSLSDGSTREVPILVPESQVKTFEDRGYRRSNTFDTLEKATRYRDQMCSLAGHPPQPSSAALLNELCNAANQAIAEWK